MKTCTKCLIKKPFEEFRKDKSKKDGYYSSCGDCYRKLHGQIKGQRPTIHGMTKTRFYRCWNSAKQRCENIYDNRYNYYGGRGIKMEWDNFEKFKEDMYESYLEHSNIYGEIDTTIDRIDVNGNYCKENCRWATYLIQARNKRNTQTFLVNGKQLTSGEISNQFGIKPQTFIARVNRYGYSVEDALNVLLHKRSGRRVPNSVIQK